MEKETIMHALMSAISTDDETYEDASDEMIRVYESGGQEWQTAINEFCIAICGYSFETLQEGINEK